VTLVANHFTATKDNLIGKTTPAKNQCNTLTINTYIPPSGSYMGGVIITNAQVSDT